MWLYVQSPKLHVTLKTWEWPGDKATKLTHACKEASKVTIRYKVVATWIN